MEDFVTTIWWPGPEISPSFHGGQKGNSVTFHYIRECVCSLFHPLINKFSSQAFVDFSQYIYVENFFPSSGFSILFPPLNPHFLPSLLFIPSLIFSLTIFEDSIQSKENQRIIEDKYFLWLTTPYLKSDSVSYVVLF